jgi:hypothetical protein
MGHHVIEFDQRCESCDGTGVFVGMAERDGFAVQCRTCKGEGHYEVRIEYDDFEKLERREGVKRVILWNPGIILAGKDLDAYGGLSYDDWLNGKEFGPGTEMRRYTCPAWFMQRGTIWDKCTDTLGRAYSQCPHFRDKESCWKQWDEELQ